MSARERLKRAEAKPWDGPGGKHCSVKLDDLRSVLSALDEAEKALETSQAEMISCGGDGYAHSDSNASRAIAQDLRTIRGGE